MSFRAGIAVGSAAVLNGADSPVAFATANAAWMLPLDTGSPAPVDVAAACWCKQFDSGAFFGFVLLLDSLLASLLLLLPSAGRHKVVAIDTEHHSYESYKGFVCLLQLSTCSGVGAAKDFIVDPFSLFAHLPALNELTANPKILKILHGSASDVLWLQVSLLLCNGYGS